MNRKTEPQNGESAKPAQLVLVTQNYFVSQGDYDQGERHNDPDAAFLTRRFMETDWKDPDKRPIFKLARIGSDKAIFIQARRNQSDRGELHVAWCGLADGRYQQGESTKIGSSEKLLEMMRAFLNDDPKLVNLVEWDFLQ